MELVSKRLSLNENEESENLIDINNPLQNNNFVEPFFPELNIKKKENIFKKFVKLPLVCSFFIILIFFTIILLIVYLVVLSKSPDYEIFDIDWENNYLNDRKYKNYRFKNGLEVMLIQDEEFENDGGAIVIDKGYMDNPKDEGISIFAASLLNYAFQSLNKNLILDQYFGNYAFETEEYFTNFRFDILNAGFKKYLGIFSLVLNPSNISDFFDQLLNDPYKLSEIESLLPYDYNLRSKLIYYRENHLLEYLVYNLKNSSNQEILPEGNYKRINQYIQYNTSVLKEKVINYINELINPKNIKIVIFSKYKFLISSKYLMKHFEYLINKKPEESDNDIKKSGDNKENSIENIQIKTSQLIYIKPNIYESDYIKIIYYINRIKEETFSELFYKKDYFRYIVDILSERKEGSLYSLLINNSNSCINSLYGDYEIIFKSKIKFCVYIGLHCLKNNINDIILITYQYIEKIINTPIQIDRYIEMKDIFNQTNKYIEKSYDTIDLAKNNGRNIFLTKYTQKYYFYPLWLPWEINLSYEENVKKINNESFLYFSQLKPENSVIILGFKNENNIICDSSFPLNCSIFKKIHKKTNYYKVEYINTTFDPVEFGKYLGINNSVNNISPYIKNNYISKHNETYDIVNQYENTTLIGNQTLLNNFYFKRNINIRIPKIFISINLLHPYLRPLLDNTKENECFFFQILEIFSAIKRKTYEVLADAIRAGNDITIDLNENYFYINLICYEDVAYNIVNEIKKIILDINWESSDFISNNDIYKYETIYNFFNFNFHSYEEISHYYFYCMVKNGLFNKYEFFKESFDYYHCKNNLSKNIHLLNKFIINGLIYGYYDKSSAEKLVNIFKRNNFEDDKTNIQSLLKQVNNSISIENFVDWVNEIKQLKELKTDHIDINERVLSKNNFFNFGSRYITVSSDLDFNKKYMNISLLYNVFNNMKSSAFYYFSINMIIYRDIYFCIFVFEPNDQFVNPNNDTFIKSLLDELLNDTDRVYQQPVDNIGDRFYYLQKNLISVLFKKKSSLLYNATEELNYMVYKYSILNPEEIIKEYNDKKKGKNYKFDILRQFYNEIDLKQKLDINTIFKKN